MKRIFKAICFLLIAGHISAQGWLGDGVNTIHSENASSNLTPILVGIGTSSPAAQFHTTGSVRFAGITQDNTQTRIMVQNSSGDIYWRDATTIGGNNWSLTGNTGTTPGTNYIGTTDANRLVFKTGATEYMTLSTGGFLGIGTTSPVTRLHVGAGGLYQLTAGNFPESAISATDNYSSTDGGMFAIVNGDPNNLYTTSYQDKGGSMIFGGRDAPSTVHITTYARIRGLKETAATSGAGQYSGYLTLDTRNASGGLSEKMRITSTGSVCIGSTSPRTYTTGTTTTLGTAPANNTVALLDVNGLIYTNTLVSLSDGRFKKNIQQVDNALSTVLKLRGVSYDWDKETYKDRNFDDQKQAGFIAQEVEKVYPVAVVKDDKGYYAMNYNAMLPLLTEAIKELNAKTDENAKLKDALDNTNATLISTNATVVILQKQLDDICNSGCAALKGSSSNSDQSNQLMQNMPNPFSQQTSIGYILNTGTTAYMNINGLDGKVVRHIDLAVKGAGAVLINANEMAAGTYTYTLVVDTKVIDTKIMVITAQD